MKQYEIMTIYKLTLGEEGSRGLSNNIKDLVTSLGGKVLDSTFMGKRRFAYQIKNDKEGYYEVVSLESTPESVKKLKEKLNLLDGLVRYLITAK